MPQTSRHAYSFNLHRNKPNALVVVHPKPPKGATFYKDAFEVALCLKSFNITHLIVESNHPSCAELTQHAEDMFAKLGFVIIKGDNEYRYESSKVTVVRSH